MTELKAPFPAFGGKSKIARLVWSRLEDVRNYIEPFCFSAAMLLARPTPGKVETINDLNAYVANFWRAVQADPEAVARHADWPINETDLHARHRWLVQSDEVQAGLQRVRQLPNYFDPQIAGWWCWGACCWIGAGWCLERGGDPWVQIPVLSVSQGVNPSGRLVNSPPHQKRPRLVGFGEAGVHGGGRIQLADAYARGRGVNGNDRAMTCEERRAWLTEWLFALRDRLRPVRVCCGEWRRVCNSPSTMTRLGLTGVFLDPPYRKTVGGKKNRAGDLYSNDSTQDVDALCDAVQNWCLVWGDDSQVRIALCGLEGEYPKLGHWECVAWESTGGYGNQAGAKSDNARRERVWFSPACAKPSQRQLDMFSQAVAAE